MFNKLKQFKDLREQAKHLQDSLSQEKITVDKNGISITVDGNLKLSAIDISESLLTPANKQKIEETLKDLHSDALKKIQRTMALKMKEMGGLPNIPGLS